MNAQTNCSRSLRRVSDIYARASPPRSRSITAPSQRRTNETAIRFFSTLFGIKLYISCGLFSRLLPLPRWHQPSPAPSRADDTCDARRRLAPTTVTECTFSSGVFRFSDDFRSPLGFPDRCESRLLDAISFTISTRRKGRWGLSCRGSLDDGACAKSRNDRASEQTFFNTGSNDVSFRSGRRRRDAARRIAAL
jgi:hypothetical protein